MAILRAVETESGVMVENAYARIDTISGSKNQIAITLNYYLSQSHYTDGKSYVHQEVYSYEPEVEGESDNFIKQGYEHIKSLSGFSKAIDA
ncbi:hypothetical protein GC096_03875 [Paenibacillus sp. LMG 31461]|uniref:Uncharacterized protein n=1 Tax=Paenibacillus plantarum TaxID=2654975 RepID=A0ABX1X534_9BACL|nr:hypothetical protein [Paenibacillus plantarum]NOU63184.1 hypothetical protein [Paenibacillus plantarum]